MQLNRISFGIINVRGINKKGKWDKMFSILKKKKFTFIILQETKLAMNNRFYWKEFERLYHIWEDRCQNSRLGLVIAVSKEHYKDYEFTFKITNNRLCSLLCVSKECVFTVMNIHFPILSVNRENFYRRLELEMVALINPIIMGDWNVNSETKERRLCRFLKDFGLVDLAEFNSLTHINTRPNKTGGNNLDRVVSTVKWIHHMKIGVEEMIFTDHRLLCVGLVNEKVDNNIYKLRPIFEDLKDTKKCEDWIIEMKKFRLENEDLCGFSIWTTLKLMTYSGFVQAERRQARGIQVDIEKTSSQLKNMFNLEDKNNMECIKLKHKLEALINSKFAALKTKSQGLWKFSKNTNKDKMIQSLRKRKSKITICKLQWNTNVYCKDVDIAHQYLKRLQQLAEFGDIYGYSDLHYAKFKNITHYAFFVGKTDIVLSSQQKVAMEEKFTSCEIAEAFKKMNLTGSPGPDLINGVFYQYCIKSLFELLSQVLNEIGSEVMDRHTLSCMNQVDIIPIGKESFKGETISIHDIRPIGILNFDFKLFNRVILDRIVPYLKLILPSEMKAIRGKGISQAIWDHFCVFKNRENMNKRVYLIRVDMTKAFSMTNINYLKYLMYKYLGENITTNTCLRLIREKQLSVKIGKVQTNYIDMNNGLIQGSPLSGDLYNLYLIDLVKVLKRNVRGIRIKDRRSPLCITTYIDDISVYADSKRDVYNAINVLKDFQSMTGSLVNFDKSYVFDLKLDKTVNNKDLRGQHGKILGISFRGSVQAINDRILNIKLEEIKILLKKWELFGGSMIRRVKLLNKLIIPRLLYFLKCESITNKWLTVFRSICKKYIFGKLFFLSGVKASYPLEKGGLNLLDIHCLYESIKYKNFEQYFLLSEDSKQSNQEYFENHKVVIIKQMAKIYYRIHALNVNDDKICYKKIRELTILNDQNFISYKGKGVNLKTIEGLGFEDGIENFIIKWSLGVLQTKVWLAYRHIYVKDVDCPMCQESEEDIQHIFAQCRAVKGFITSKVEDVVKSNKLREIILNLGKSNSELISLKNKKWIFCALYTVWRARNHSIFKYGEFDLESNFKCAVKREFRGDLRARSFLWINNHWNEKVIDNFYFS